MRHSLSSVLPFIRFLDAANLLTAMNVVICFATVVLARTGHLSFAAATMALAAAVDFVDGHVARTWLADNKDNRAFGQQLDSLADLLNFSVAPALLLLQVANSTAAAAAGAFLVLSGALRLAVFGASKLVAPSSYLGLPTTYSGLLLALAYQCTAAGRLGPPALITLTALVGVLQVTNLRIPKLKAAHAVFCIAVSFLAVTLLLRIT